MTSGLVICLYFFGRLSAEASMSFGEMGLPKKTVILNREKSAGITYLVSRLFK